MDKFTALRQADPVDRDAVERALTHPVFDELFDSLVADSTEPEAVPLTRRRRQVGRSPLHRWRVPAAVAAAIVVLLGLLAGVGVIGDGGGLGHPFTTAWKPARAFTHATSDHTTRHGTWRLIDALLTGTWQQNFYGPPPGWFSCSSDGTCYVFAGKYASASAAAPLSASLYVSTDDGTTWSSLPAPNGLLPTTPLECSGAQWCAAGGTYNGQPVLAVTRNGGHSFTVDPLPTGVGTLRSLTCPSTGVCMGLVTTSPATRQPVDATFLVTDDGGTSFDNEPILAGDSMVDLACTSTTDCTAVGTTDASLNDPIGVGVSAVTSDQGRTWTPGAFPAGFGIREITTSLACADARHCFVTGSIPIPNQNLPQCASGPQTLPPPPPSTHGLPAMSPQVASISKAEAKLAAAAAAQEYVTTHVVSCTNSRVTQVGDVASSSDGGLTWTPEVLPSDVPSPNLDGLTCPTATECWASGSEEVPEKIGKSTGGGSPVLLGTTDGGSSWSKVMFSVPSTAPNPTGQSYVSMGSITCPTAGVCLARGSAAQNAPYAADYSLIVPGG